MNSTILLDFDGVIVDSIELFSEVVNVAGRKLNRSVSIEPEDLRNIKRMSILEISNVAGIEKNLMRAFVTEIDGELSRRADEIPIFPHMTDVIENQHGRKSGDCICDIKAGNFQGSPELRD